MRQLAGSGPPPHEPPPIRAGSGPAGLPVRAGLLRLLRLTPVQRSSGGKQKLGQITKAGERTLRRLLVIGPAR